MDTITLDKQLVQDIANYLAEKPFKEVAGLIQKIGEQIQKQAQAPSVGTAVPE